MEEIKKEQDLNRSQLDSQLEENIKVNSQQENQQTYIQDIYDDKKSKKTDSQSPFTKRIKKGALVLLTAGIVAMIAVAALSTGGSVDKSPEAKQALETHVSTEIAAGTRLLQNDDEQNFAGQDVTIQHNTSAGDTKIYIWDYAAEDGDYVQVFIDGVSQGEPFMIKNNPVSFSVPTVGVVEVVGTRDGGGGITYAVYDEVNQTTYLNGMDVGGSNTYTMVNAK